MRNWTKIGNSWRNSCIKLLARLDGSYQMYKSISYIRVSIYWPGLRIVHRKILIEETKVKYVVIKYIKHVGIKQNPRANNNHTRGLKHALIKNE